MLRFRLKIAFVGSGCKFLDHPASSPHNYCDLSTLSRTPMFWDLFWGRFEKFGSTTWLFGHTIDSNSTDAHGSKWEQVRTKFNNFLQLIVLTGVKSIVVGIFVFHFLRVKKNVHSLPDKHYDHIYTQNESSTFRNTVVFRESEKKRMIYLLSDCLVIMRKWTLNGRSYSWSSETRYSCTFHLVDLEHCELKRCARFFEDLFK